MDDMAGSSGGKSLVSINPPSSFQVQWPGGKTTCVVSKVGCWCPPVLVARTADCADVLGVDRGAPRRDGCLCVVVCVCVCTCEPLVLRLVPWATQGPGQARELQQPKTLGA
ncbi:unnamed protein product [Ostreobium quekettii]|uniref:Uncharacterized protein n=1 Tax=Ostreobium quekettii TaxID=121088 RepID=A0A8S1IKQ8_9CHLO|nr:unnamed protein product [Ostreobium quekettii]